METSELTAASALSERSLSLHHRLYNFSRTVALQTCSMALYLPDRTSAYPQPHIAVAVLNRWYSLWVFERSSDLENHWSERAPS